LNLTLAPVELYAKPLLGTWILTMLDLGISTFALLEVVNIKVFSFSSKDLNFTSSPFSGKTFPFFDNKEKSSIWE